MKRRLTLSSLFFAFIALWTAYTSCESPHRFASTNITIMGNPLAPAGGKILPAICTVLNRCDSQVNLQACEQGVLAASGIDYQLGLPQGSYPNFSSIVQAEQTNALVASQAAVENCVSAIENLSCTDPGVAGAYNPNLANPFSAVASMIPTAPGICPAVFSTPPGTQDYYVATTGSDANDGSKENPWATLNHASQALQLGPGGATVHVAPGIYSPAPASCPSASSCGVFTSRSGTASARIVYVSDQKWGAKIAPIGAYVVWHNSGDYVDIIGFDIAGDSPSHYGINSEASSVRIMGNHIHDIPMPGCTWFNGVGGAGIMHGKTSSLDNETIGNVVHDIGPLRPDGLSTDSYCNDGNGISHIHPGGRIQNNLVYRVATWGILTYWSATDFAITNNLVFRSGVTVGDGGRLGGALLINANSPGVTMNNTTVSNNVFRNNGGVGIAEGGSTGTNNLYLNNVIFANHTDFDFKTGQAIGTITADPQMVNFQPDGSGDYRLNTSSPAKDGGSLSCASGTANCSPPTDINGFARPYGPAIDIGPYEWHP